MIGDKQHSLGVLRYEKQEELSEEAMFAIIACAVFFVIVLIIGGCCCLYKFRRNDDMMKKMRKEMDQLESRVANECKDGECGISAVPALPCLVSPLTGMGWVGFCLVYKLFLHASDIDHLSSCCVLGNHFVLS